MNHPCARCGKDTPEEGLVWLEKEDDFVCQPCEKKSIQASKNWKSRRTNVARRLEALHR